MQCSCASGYVIPPFIIFDRTTINPELTKERSSWNTLRLIIKKVVDMEPFSGWFLNHFLKYASTCRPLLSLLDASNYCSRSLRWLLRSLPPNTTHLAQPLDRGCFLHWKTSGKKVVQAFVAQNYRAVRHYDFNSLFSLAWINAMSMKNVMSGFRVCGIYPFNREAPVLPEK